MPKTIVSMADNIVRDLPGSITPDREKAVIQSIQDFAIRSGFFKFTTEQTVTEYDVDSNANDSVSLNPIGLGKYRPYRIERILIDGVNKPIVRKELRSDMDDFDSVYKNGVVYYDIDVRGRLILFPFPTDTAFETASGSLAVTIEAIYTIDDDTTEVDDFFYARWGKTIEDGATGLMMSEFNKSWSNPNGAAQFINRYDAGRNSALMKRNLEEAGGELKAQLIKF